MGIVIREAEEIDLPRILALYSTYIMNTNYTFEYVTPPAVAFLDRFRSITAQFPWLICEVDGELAGYAYASTAFERIAYQWDADVTIYLDEKYHRMGIGKKLYDVLFRLLMLQGYYTLYAVITATNETSVNFHRSLGFSDIGVFHNTGYKAGEWLDVLWMEKPLRTYGDAPVPPVQYKSLNRERIIKIFSGQQA